MKYEITLQDIKQYLSILAPTFYIIQMQLETRQTNAKGG